MDSHKDQKEYAVIKLSSGVQSYPTFSRTTSGWIKYDKDNLLPQRIIELNNNSSINRSIIENKVTYICGAGLDPEEYYGRPNPNGEWNDLIEKLATDYVTFGGFCFQVILNKDGVNVSLYHTDFSKIRVGEVNEYGMAQNYYISNDWTKTTGKNAPVDIKAYGVEELKQNEPYLYYYMDYQPSLQYYPIPEYYSALNYIEAEGLLGKFYRNSIHNGFTPSVIITMPSNPEEKIKEQFDRDLKSTFSGTNGANAIVVLWGENGEVKPVITPFSSANNADTYNNVDQIIFQKIISAHRLTSPTLAGLSGSGNLSGNANEIINAYILYNYTVIHKLRRKILETLSIFTIKNGYKKLKIVDLDIIGEIKKNNETINSNDTVTVNQ